MRAQIKNALLLCLQAADGEPMPEVALIAAAQIKCRPARPTISDVEVALQELEAEKFAAAVTDDFSKERSWTLTTKGTHKARQL